MKKMGGGKIDGNKAARREYGKGGYGRQKLKDGGMPKAKPCQTMKVSAPKGYHWMKSGKTYKLMKDPKGGYKPHKGASKTANFAIQKVHKK